MPSIFVRLFWLDGGDYIKICQAFLVAIVVRLKSITEGYPDISIREMFEVSNRVPEQRVLRSAQEKKSLQIIIPEFQALKTLHRERVTADFGNSKKEGKYLEIPHQRNIPTHPYLT